MRYKIGDSVVVARRFRFYYLYSCSRYNRTKVLSPRPQCLSPSAASLPQLGCFCTSDGLALLFRVSIQVGESHFTPHMQAKFDECRSQFGLNSAFSSEERIARAKVLFLEAFFLADEILACNQAIFD
jgi:hypothetical protein